MNRWICMLIMLGAGLAYLTLYLWVNSPSFPAPVLLRTMTIPSLADPPASHPTAPKRRFRDFTGNTEAKSHAPYTLNTEQAAVEGGESLAQDHDDAVNDDDGGGGGQEEWMGKSSPSSPLFKGQWIYGIGFTVHPPSSPSSSPIRPHPPPPVSSADSQSKLRPRTIISWWKASSGLLSDSLTIHTLHFDPQSPGSSVIDKQVLPKLYLNGTISSISFAKQSSSLHILYSKAQNEDITFHRLSCAITPDHVALTYHTFPGTALVKAFSVYTHPKEKMTNALYIRRPDSFLFRLTRLSTDPSPVSSGAGIFFSKPAEPVPVSIRGPPLLSASHRILFLAQVYAEPGRHAVFTVRFCQETENEAEVFFEIWYTSSFASSSSSSLKPGSWSQSILWHKKIVGMDGDFLPADEGQNYYFLSNPAVAFSPSRRSFAFVFTDQLFSFDYRPSDSTQRRLTSSFSSSGEHQPHHGFSLIMHPIENVWHKALKVIHADLDASATHLTLVNSDEQLLFFRRSFAPPSNDDAEEDFSSHSRFHHEEHYPDEEDSRGLLLTHLAESFRFFMAPLLWAWGIYFDTRFYDFSSFLTSAVSSSIPYAAWELATFRTPPNRQQKIVATSLLTVPVDDTLSTGGSDGDASSLPGASSSNNRTLFITLHRNGRVKVFDGDSSESAFMDSCREFIVGHIEMFSLQVAVIVYLATKELVRTPGHAFPFSGAQFLACMIFLWFMATAFVK